MFNKIYLPILFCSAILFVGCDNTAKIPQPNKDSIAPQKDQPITIAYSEWPGSLAWQIAQDKGWFKEAGLNVELKWFDYSASLQAFMANKLDAVVVANGDNFILSTGGARPAIIMAHDYSAGNDVIIAKSGITTLQGLKGKTIALEKGLVSDLLFTTAMQDAGLNPKDVKVTNAATNELPQIFQSPDIAAIALWQPIAHQALASVPDAKIIYDSSKKPGLIYDTLSVNQVHLQQHREEWKKIIQIWDRTVNYINDPATRQDAIHLMAKRASIDPVAYERIMKGTKLLNLAENKRIFKKGSGFDSIYGASYYVNQFNLRQGLYAQSPAVEQLINPNLIEELP